MIILDTNVVSALMQQQPDPQVVAWLDNQPAESVWLNSITLFEGRYGLALLPDGQRKKLLQERFEELLTQDLQNRIAHFDANAATQAAVLAECDQRSARLVISVATNWANGAMLPPTEAFSSALTYPSRCSR